MRRRYLTVLYELLWRVWLWVEMRAETVYRDAEERATWALYRRDHAEGGDAAARWHRDREVLAD